VESPVAEAGWKLLEACPRSVPRDGIQALHYLRGRVM
jgi:hypothetical protein